MKNLMHLLILAVVPAALAFCSNPESKSTEDGTGTQPADSTQTQPADSSAKRPTAVLMGDSITELWMAIHPEFFSGNGFVCQGISGQTTTTILARMDKAVAQQPEVFVICAGTNDIAMNDGHYVSNSTIVTNIRDMCETARENGCKVVVCSIPPCAYYSWRPDLHPEERIPGINELLKKLVRQKHYDAYVDYFTPLATESGAFDSRYTDDGCHPNASGYDRFEAILLPVIQELTSK